MSFVNSYLPLLPDRGFVPLPQEAEPLSGSPRDLVLPWGFERLEVPGWRGESELVWRYLVAVREHGEWAALRYNVLVTELLVEGGRADQTRKVMFSLLNMPADCPNVLMKGFVEVMNRLVKYGYLGANHDPSVQTIWPTPKLLEHVRRARYHGFENILMIPQIGKTP